MLRRKALDVLGWFVGWDGSEPFHYIWSDLDTRHCTYWMWRNRLAGWFVCPVRGHDWYPDMCHRPEHDLCFRCGVRRNAAR